MRLQDYLARVGVSGPLAATIESLRRLHIAHRETFLFENVAIQTGGGISVALEDIERKFLDEGRGGYCFEHNTLFLAVLRELGFTPTVLLGRVRRGPPERWCRTHMVLRVPIDGELWLADVGFGGIGLLEPIPLGDGATSHQTGVTYTMRREPDVWILSCAEPAPQDLYEFSDDPQTPGDIEVANHFTSTHRDSMFRRSLTIQRTTRTERTILRHNTFTRWADGRFDEQTIDGRRARAIAREVFGVSLPDGPLVFESYRSS